MPGRRRGWLQGLFPGAQYPPHHHPKAARAPFTLCLPQRATSPASPSRDGSVETRCSLWYGRPAALGRLVWLRLGRVWCPAGIWSAAGWCYSGINRYFPVRPLIGLMTGLLGETSTRSLYRSTAAMVLYIALLPEGVVWKISPTFLSR